MIDPKRFVRKVVQGISKPEGKKESGKWAMEEDVMWLRKPEMWCQYCGVSWINKWTWLVDARRGKVVGVWDERGLSLNLRHLHPHVMSDGTICMGNTLQIVEALTSGFNIKSCFCWTDSFVSVMAGLGHEDCEQVWKNVEEEEDDAAYCESCEREYDTDEVTFYEQPNQYLCDECWDAMCVTCDRCESHFYYPDNGMIRYPLTEVRGGDVLCDYCLEDYTICEKCDEYVRCEELQEEPGDEDPICEKCWRDAREECRECGRFYPKDEMTNEICDGCQERIEAEEAAMADDGSVQLELPLEAGEADNVDSDCGYV